jgi:hypothetical protein
VNTASLVGYLVSAAISAVVTGLYHYFVASKGGSSPASTDTPPPVAAPVPEAPAKHPLLATIEQQVVQQFEAAMLQHAQAWAASIIPAAPPAPTVTPKS